MASSPELAPPRHHRLSSARSRCCRGPRLLAPLAPAEPPLQPLDLDRGATGLALALRRVGVSGRVLFVTAHPDDEHNGVLVRLSRGLGLRTALLTVTRGEGGQNAIGPELFGALGVLRTGELTAIHRYDGVEQYFGRAYEFGFSFSVEETLAKWGREETLGDVVRVVRAFRPDVILTLPLEGEGGGQHHQAVGRLAREAFRAAADPARFPEQLREGLRPWQARKIYQGGVGGYGEVPGTPVRVPTGVYDPVLGMTWQQLGARARAMHRCQGAGQLGADPGPAEGVFSLLDAEPAVDRGRGRHPRRRRHDARGARPLGPPPRSRARRAAGEGGRRPGGLRSRRSREGRARPGRGPRRRARARGGARRPGRRSRRARRDRRAPAGGRGRTSRPRSPSPRASCSRPAPTTGSSRPARRWASRCRCSTAGGPGSRWRSSSSRRPRAGRWRAARARPARFPAGAHGGRASPSVVAPDARPSQPYWRRERDRDRNELLVPADETRPWSPPALVARARCRVNGVVTTLRTPVAWRYEGPFVGGERRHEVQVVPALSVRVSPEITAVPLASPRRPIEVRVFARHLAPGAATADVRLEAPPGWSVDPPSSPLRFSYEGRRRAPASASRRPPSSHAGALALRAVAVRDGREFREAVQAVDYDHVERRQLLRPAETRVLVLDLRTAPGVSVGYVMGPGDALADAIRQMGVPLTLLTAEDLLFGDLSRFTTIVTGIRAYETREDLRSSHGRLLRWVEAGGHLVVQYNRAAFNRLAPDAPSLPADAPSPYAPFPAAVTSERISDETAPMRVLVPAPPPAHRAEPDRRRRLGGLGAGARDPVPRRARPALHGAAGRDRPLPLQPRREAGDPRRGEGGQGDLDLRRARALPAGAGRRARGLAAPRQPRQPSEGERVRASRRAACRPRSWPGPRSS